MHGWTRLRRREQGAVPMPWPRLAESRGVCRQRRALDETAAGARAGTRSVSRAFVVVLDACGVGALPDAVDYGDRGTNTLGHLAERLGGLRVPTLAALGLGSILDLHGVAPASAPVVHGRLHPLGPGKDSTTGDRELMGVVATERMPTYPSGFPDEVLDVV